MSTAAPVSLEEKVRAAARGLDDLAMAQLALAVCMSDGDARDSAYAIAGVLSMCAETVGALLTPAEVTP